MHVSIANNFLVRKNIILNVEATICHSSTSCFYLLYTKNKHKNHVYHMYITIKLNKTLLGKKTMSYASGEFQHIEPQRITVPTENPLKLLTTLKVIISIAFLFAHFF